MLNTKQVIPKFTQVDNILGQTFSTQHTLTYIPTVKYKITQAKTRKIKSFQTNKTIRLFLLPLN